MTITDEKSALLEELDASYRAALDFLAPLDPPRVIDVESGWRVKDIVGHIVTWESEKARALFLHRRGGAAKTDSNFDRDDFNAAAAHTRYDQSMAQIYADWSAARGWFKVLVGAMQSGDLDAEMAYPYQGRGTVRDLVLSVIETPTTHFDHIRDKYSTT